MPVGDGPSIQPPPTKEIVTCDLISRVAANAVERAARERSGWIEVRGYELRKTRRCKIPTEPPFGLRDDFIVGSAVVGVVHTCDHLMAYALTFVESRGLTACASQTAHPAHHAYGRWCEATFHLLTEMGSAPVGDLDSPSAVIGDAQLGSVRTADRPRIELLARLTCFKPSESVGSLWRIAPRSRRGRGRAPKGPKCQQLPLTARLTGFGPSPRHPW